MDRKRILAIMLLIIAMLVIVSVPVWLLTPLGANVLGLGQPNLNGPPLTPIAYTPVPKTTLKAILTPKGQPGAIDASEALLMDDDTGNILYAKNELTPVPMASTTKIMTALIALQGGNLNQMITISQNAHNQLEIGSNANLQTGEQFSLKDLLYALLLPSGDDAAVAIAEGIAGSTANFVTIMNTEARRLQLFQTHFYTASGLDTDLYGNAIPAGTHFTTSADLVRLARYAMSIPLFATIVATSEYTLPATSTHGVEDWKTTNTLLNNYQGMLGIKTGWTGAAGGCLVFAAKRNGHTLIGVVLHSVGAASLQVAASNLSDDQKTTQEQSLDEQTRAADAKILLDWGFGLPVQLPQV